MVVVEFFRVHPVTIKNCCFDASLSKKPRLGVLQVGLWQVFQVMDAHMVFYEVHKEGIPLWYGVNDVLWQCVSQLLVIMEIVKVGYEWQAGTRSMMQKMG